MQGKGSTFIFLSYFKTLSIDPAPGIFRRLNSQCPALKSSTPLTELHLDLLQYMNINAKVDSELPSHLNSPQGLQQELAISKIHWLFHENSLPTFLWKLHPKNLTYMMSVFCSNTIILLQNTGNAL